MSHVPKALGGRLQGLSLRRQVWVLSVWPLLEGVMSWLVGTVDLALAGRLPGADETRTLAALDALGVAAYVGWLQGMIFTAMGTGAAALIARAIGGRHRRLANAALGQGITAAAVAGLLVGGAIAALSPLLASLVKLSPQATQDVVVYLRVLAWGMVGSSVMMTANAAMRASGDTRSPFLIMLAVNACNIAVSFVLVYAPAPLGGHGVAGIAWGTVAAWLLGGTLALSALVRGHGGLRLRAQRLIYHGHTMRRVLRVALPAMAESVLVMWLGNFIILTLIGRLGGEGLQGSHMIAIRVESMSFLPGFALGMAAAVLAGQYLGAGDTVMARRAVMLCWRLAAGVMTLLGLLFIALPELLVLTITDAPAALEISPPLIRLCGFIQLFFATSIVLSTALRGVGDTRATLRITLFSIFGVRLPAAYLIGLVMGQGLYGVWIALCGELVVRGCLFSARFVGGRWTRLQV